MRHLLYFRLISRIVLFCFSWSALSFAQAPVSDSTSQSADQKFTANADLVLVPVVVRQGKQYVPGLTKDNFVVLENGASQSVAFVNEIASTAAPLKRNSTEPDVFSNEIQQPDTPPRLTVIVVDSVNTTITDQPWVVDQVSRYLRGKSGRLEPTAILGFTIDGVRMVHDFSTDSASLMAALELASGRKVRASSGGEARKPELVMGVLSLADKTASGRADTWVDEAGREAIADPSGAICRVRLEHTLENLNVVAQSIPRIPGRKSMLWITSASPFAGFYMPDHFVLPQFSQAKPHAPTGEKGGQAFAAPANSVFFDGPKVGSCDFSGPELVDLQALFRRITNQLADSGLAVYPVDARGIVVGFPGADVRVDADQMMNGSGDLGKAQADVEYWNSIAMHNFAEWTGARPCLRNNDFSDCMQDVATDSENYYLLGYYRDKRNDKPGWRNLEVKVNRPDVTVLAQSGYFYSNQSQNQDEARLRDVSSALNSPVNFLGIPFTVTVQPQSEDDSKSRTLNLRFSVPPSSLADSAPADHRMSLELVAKASEAKGAVLDTFAKTLVGSFMPGEPTSVLNTGLVYIATLHVPPGEVTLHFVVRDNVNGRIGSIVVPYTVQ
jgi:VWFA-related protein